MGVIDWKNPESLRNLSGDEAVQVLSQISQALAKSIETTDNSVERRYLHELANASPEAIEFAEAARRLHRRAIASVDCRPSLRVAADERRVTDALRKSPEEDASEYAARCRERLRVKF